MNNTRTQSRISEERKAEIQCLASSIALRHAEIPVQPLKILAEKKITHSFNYYGDDFDGMLEHKSGTFHVYCNLNRVEQRNSPRARFTLAHELGHYFIDEHRRALASGRQPMHQSNCEFSSRNIAEQEADLFASALLMPPDLFKEKAKRYPAGFHGIRTLADHFKTSWTSTALRYAQSDITPCAVIKWTSEKKAWSCTSTETSRAHLHTTINSIDKLPHDSATTRALKGVIPPSAGFFQCGTTAATWFSRISESAEKNPILIEQAIPLGRFGVLTILYPVEGKY
jgi:Zn-dependent peptidase ImmA (M78 family)